VRVRATRKGFINWVSPRPKHKRATLNFRAENNKPKLMGLTEYVGPRLILAGSFLIKINILFNIFLFMGKINI